MDSQEARSSLSRLGRTGLLTIAFIVLLLASIAHIGAFMGASDIAACGSTTLFSFALFFSPAAIYVVFLVVAGFVSDGPLPWVIALVLLICVFAVDLWYFSAFVEARDAARLYGADPKVFREAMRGTSFCRFFAPLF